jgi:hypothetical protein
MIPARLRECFNRLGWSPMELAARADVFFCCCPCNYRLLIEHAPTA